MKKMLILAMTMAMVLLAAAGVCETLRVGMECNYAPYNWTQSDASENAVAIAAGGYADGYDAVSYTHLSHATIVSTLISGVTLPLLVLVMSMVGLG